MQNIPPKKNIRIGQHNIKTKSDEEKQKKCELFTRLLGINHQISYQVCERKYLFADLLCLRKKIGNPVVPLSKDKAISFKSKLQDLEVKRSFIHSLEVWKKNLKTRNTPMNESLTLP